MNSLNRETAFREGIFRSWGWAGAAIISLGRQHKGKKKWESRNRISVQASKGVQNHTTPSQFQFGLTSNAISYIYVLVPRGSGQVSTCPVRMYICSTYLSTGPSDNTFRLPQIVRSVTGMEWGLESETPTPMHNLPQLWLINFVSQFCYTGCFALEFQIKSHD